LKIKGKIFLPGTNKQVNNFLANQGAANKRILIIGEGTEEIAEEFLNVNPSEINIIVENIESLSIARNFLSNKEKVSIGLRDFDKTDFADKTFDVIYAQASISKPNRNKIIKEIKRILKDNGIFCVGEIVKLKEDIPSFVRNIFELSQVPPIYFKDLKNYYTEKKLDVFFEKDLSQTLKEFYTLSNSLLNNENIPPQEKTYYKKIMNRIAHESNAYLKMGADKYIGFYMLIARKAEY
jgi:ubiquinone/menaquinone biosynthesis C-methylase UbiE